jgi:hypothetical protein
MRIGHPTGLFNMQVRSADADEIGHLAQLWCDGWHEAHAPLAPLELTRLRTLAKECRLMFSSTPHSPLSPLGITRVAPNTVSTYSKSYGNYRVAFGSWFAASHKTEQAPTDQASNVLKNN